MEPDLQLWTDVSQMILYGIGINAIVYLWGYFLGGLRRWMDEVIK